MTRNRRNRAIFAVVLTAAAFSAAGVLPAHAQSQTPAGRLGTQFTYTYYATAAHTGEAVGEWVFGYCPTYFSDTFGTKTAYYVLSEESC
jgi:hypothetical protein